MNNESYFQSFDYQSWYSIYQDLSSSGLKGISLQAFFLSEPVFFGKIIKIRHPNSFLNQKRILIPLEKSLNVLFKSQDLRLEMETATFLKPTLYDYHKHLNTQKMILKSSQLCDESFVKALDISDFLIIETFKSYT